MLWVNRYINKFNVKQVHIGTQGIKYLSVMWPSWYIILSLNWRIFIFKLHYNASAIMDRQWFQYFILLTYRNCLTISFVHLFPSLPKQKSHWTCHHCESWADMKPFAYILSWQGMMQLWSKNHFTELFHFHVWA